MADDAQTLIEKALQDVASGKEVRINPKDYPPDVYASMRALLKPTLGEKVGNVFTGKLNRVPSYGEFDATTTPAGAKYKSKINRMGGQDPYSAAPDLAPDDLKQAKAYEAYNSSRSPQGKLELMKLFAPDVAGTAQTDPFGNVYVEQGGKKLYLNQPGVSGEDFSELGAQTKEALPLMALNEVSSGTAKPAIKAGRSLLTKILTGSGIGGYSSAAMDKTAQDAGSGQAISLPDLAINALGGGAGEAFAPVIGKMSSALFKVLKGPKYFAPSGDLNSAGQAMLNKEGLDWNTFSQETQKRIRQVMDKAASPEDALNLLASQDLPAGPIRLTKGQQTGDTGQYLDESLLRNGAMGDKAALRMKEFDQRQAGDIQANTTGVADVLNPGGTRQQAWGSGGKSVAEKLQEGKLAGKATVDEAFKGARDVGKNAYFPSVDDIHKTVLNDPEISPVLNPALLDNKSFAAAWKETENALGPDLRGDSISVKQSFELLPKLNAIIKNDPMGSYSVRQLKRTIQKGLADDALVSTVQGDPGAVEAFLKSNKLYREYANTYKAGDIVENLTEQTFDPTTGKMKFVVDPSDASKMILGAGRLGFINKTGTKQALQLLQKRLPADTWNSLREEVFLRSMGWGEKDFANEAGLVKSAADFKRALFDMKQKSPEVYTTLFNDKERALLQRFGDAYSKATLAPPTKSSTGSLTTPLAARAVQMLLPVLGPKMKGLLGAAMNRLTVGGTKIAADIAGAAKAAVATGPTFQGGANAILPKPPTTLGLGAPAGIAAGKSVEGLMNRYDLGN